VFQTRIVYTMATLPGRPGMGRAARPIYGGSLLRSIRTLIVQVFPEHRLGRIQATVDDVHEQALVGAFRLCE